MRQIIPLQTINQTFEVTLNIDNTIRIFGITLYYNRIAGYWVMKIIDPKTNTILLDSIPLLTGGFGAANILGQYKYLKIGSIFLIKNGSVTDDYPKENNLGTDFKLLWSNTPI